MYLNVRSYNELIEWKSKKSMYFGKLITIHTLPHNNFVSIFGRGIFFEFVEGGLIKS